jgi:ABC-type multidrug transport system ATPase subunit
MELVYLWVEEYKNIKNQGFNFSPRFECEYKDGNLTIDEKKDHVNIFPSNINITAIVGENGSGKSSLIKLIFLLIYCKKYESLDLINPENQEKQSSIIKTARNTYLNKNIFLIIAKKDNAGCIEYKKISLLYTLKKCYEKTFPLPQVNDGKELERMQDCTLTYDELDSKEVNLFSIHFNYMLDTFYDGEQDTWVKDIYHKADGYETSLLLEPYKNNSDRQLIDLDIIEYLNNQNMLRFYSIFDSKKKLVEFFKPNKIHLEIAQRVSGNVQNQDDAEFACLFKCTGFIANKFYQLYEDNNIFLSLREDKKVKICKIFEEIEKLYVNKKYGCLTYLYIALKVLSSNEKLFNKNEYDKIKNWATELEDEKKLLTLIENIELNNLISSNAPNYEVRKIKVCIEFINKKIYENFLFIENINKTPDLNTIKSILEFIPPWIDVEWFEDNKSIKSLSSGEKSFFTFIINLMYQIQNINDKPEYGSINLFLDETELGLHPNWQKQYLSNILKSIEQVNKKRVNIFFASHSPFLLSDLPKENVIFLEEGKQVNPFENGQTFGANIHTLLSHGFFMSDGLMGEFAKEKIQSIIKYHEEILVKELTKEENKKRREEEKEIYDKEYKTQFWQIQSIIGDDYLKQVIKNYLIEIEKIVLGNDKAKEEEIKRLEAQIKQLRK